MKKIITAAICILLLSSCVRKEDYERNIRDQQEKAIAAQVSFYNNAKELNIGEYVGFNTIDNNYVNIFRVKGGYIVNWFRGGTVFIKNEDF